MAKNSTGTIARIVESLNRLERDKCQILEGRFEETTIYLSNEFEKIRKLITKNTTNTKRKSSDITQMDGSHSSPDYKRLSNEKTSNSLTFQQESLLENKSSNLPSDLSKLRKDQLMMELDKLNVSYNKKLLKKDLVDLLKLTIEKQIIASSSFHSSNQEIRHVYNKQFPQISHEGINEQSDRICQLVDEISTEQVSVDLPVQPFSIKSTEITISADNKSTEITISAETTAQSIRKASILNMQSSTESLEDRRQRLSTEFEARQKRSRESQLTSVQLINNTSIIESSDFSTNPLNPSLFCNVSAGKLESSSQEFTESQDVTHDVLPAVLEDDMIKISLDCKPENPLDIPIIEKLETKIEIQAEIPIIANCQPIIKKPVNLVTSQTSFLDKPTTKPVYVAALEKAKLAKQAEELKLQQKKKLTDSKITSNATTKSSNSTTNNTSNIQSNNLLNNSSNQAINPFLKTTAPSNAGTISTWGRAATAAPLKPTVAAMKKPTASIFPSFFSKKTAAITYTSTITDKPVDKLVTEKNIVRPIDRNVDDQTCNEVDNSTDKQRNLESKAKRNSSLEVEFDSQSYNHGLTGQNISQTLSTVNNQPFSPSNNQNKSQQPYEDISNLSSQADREQIFEQVTPVVKEATKNEPPPFSTFPKPTVGLQVQPTLPDKSSVDEKSDPGDSYELDDDSSSGTDDDSSNDNKEKKHIPEWARSTKLRAALERQYGLVTGIPPIDPDLIFPEVTTCDLEEIFGSKAGISKNRVYSKRTSSGKWDADSITLVEKRTYRFQMGYTNEL